MFMYDASETTWQAEVSWHVDTSGSFHLAWTQSLLSKMTLQCGFEYLVEGWGLWEDPNFQ